MFEAKGVKMRILLIGAASTMFGSAAGFGQDSALDDGVRSSFRETAVNSCVIESRSSPNSSQYDWPRLCGCAIDRYLAGFSTSDLGNTDPKDPALRAATEQCALEQSGGAAAPPQTGEPASEESNAAKPKG